MIKNKKKHVEEKIIEDDLEDSYEDLEDENEIDDVKEEYLENPLHLAGKIHAQSELYKQFPHLSPDVKIAFFDKFDKINFRYKSHAYQTYTYVNKINSLASLELKNKLLAQKELYDCVTFNDFEEYFKKYKKTSLFLNVKNQDEYTKEELALLFYNQLKEVKDNGLLDEIFGTKEEFNKIYNEYLSKNGEINKVIDDIGLMNDMATNTETSKAYLGKERNALNTTINISRDVSTEEQMEEKPEESESNSGFKKFFRGKK